MSSSQALPQPNLKRTGTQAVAERERLRKRLLKMIVQSESVRKFKPR